MSDELKEVKFPDPEEPKYSDKECPSCKQKKLAHGPIPCPDSKEGCLVMHYGYTCHACWKMFQ